MPIILDRFGGIAPKINPSSLSEDGAQQAHNVELTGGVLAPINIKEPFYGLHTVNESDVLTMDAGVPIADVRQITKPSAPTVQLIDHIAKPSTWLKVFVSDWVSWTDDFGDRIVVRPRFHELGIIDLRYTETGFFFLCFLPAVSYTFLRGGPTFLRGPKYQLQFTGGIPGGPEQGIVLPITATEADPEFPPQKIACIDSVNNIYGSFQVVDVSGPRYDNDIFVEDFDQVTWTLPNFFGSYIAFEVNMHYAIPRRRHFFYAQTAVTEAEEEGPPSEISSRITLRPGELLTLNTPRPVDFNLNKLYRSVTGGDDFLLVDDVNANSYTDTTVQLKSDVIPPFGNFPGSSEPDLDERLLNLIAFLEGSFLHPAQFGVAFKDKTVYMSDQFRLHAWPDENTVAFQETIIAIANTGNTVLVFAGDNVWGVTGSSPLTMTKTKLSETTPLLNKGSLCRIGATVFFATVDGLAAATGSGVQLITNQHFTREQWQFFSPELMRATTADNSILMETTTASNPDVVVAIGHLGPAAFNNLPPNLFPSSEPDTAVNLRFDLDEDKVAVSTYTALSNGDAIGWHSRRYYFEQPTLIEYVRVVADGYPVTLKLAANRQEIVTQIINDNRPVQLPVKDAEDRDLIHAKEWDFLIISEKGEADKPPIVRRVELYDKVVVTIGDDVRFTPENTPIFQSMWVKFSDKDRFVAGVLSAQTDASVSILFFPDGGTLSNPSDPLNPFGEGVTGALPTHIQQVTGGRPFILPRTLDRAAFWRISIDSPAHIDELYLARRTTESVGDGLREVNHGDIPPWMVKRYEFADRREVKSLIVHAKANVTMNLYYDDSETVSKTVTITGATEVRIASALISALEFDFDGQDDRVTEVIIFTAQVQSIDVSGINVTNPPSLRRNLFKFADRGRLACGSIGADDYAELQVDIYGDGTLQDTQEVDDGKVFVLDRKKMKDAAELEIDVRAAGDVNRIVMMPRRPVEIEGKSIAVDHGGTIPPWLFSRYEFAEETFVVSVRIEAEKAVSIRIWLDEASSTTSFITLQPGVETLLEIGPARSLEFDFNGNDDSVQQVMLFGRETVPVGEGGISIADRKNWRKLRYKFADEGTFACASVGVDDYADVKMTLFADGIAIPSRTVTDGKLFFFPRSFTNGTVWDIDVETASDVHNLFLMQRKAVGAGSVIREMKLSTLAPWLHRRYEYPSPTQIKSLVVESDVYPLTMRFYCDGANDVTKSVIVTNSQEIRVDLGQVCGSVEFDFDGKDNSVRQVSVYAPEVQVIGPQGIDIQGPQNWRGLRFRFEDKGVFAAAGVGASSYDDVTLTLYADGVSVFSQKVTDAELITLPRTLVEATSWEVDIDTDAEIEGIFVFPRATEILQGNRIGLNRIATQSAQWIRSRYVFPDRAEIKAATVIADSYPVNMNLYCDGAVAATKTVTITGPGDVRITGMPLCASLDIDFGGDDKEVSEIRIFGDVPRSVGNAPVDLPNSPTYRGRLFQFVDKGRFAVVSVAADDEAYKDMVLTLYTDGVEVFKSRVRNGMAFQLPRTLDKGTVWEADIDTPGEVHNLILIPWIRQSVGGESLHVVGNPEGVSPWLFTEYEFGARVVMKSVFIRSDIYPVSLDLYVDGSTEKQRRNITTGSERIVGFRPEYTTLSFDFNGRDRDVHDVYLFPQQYVSLESGGFTMRRGSSNVTPWRNKTLHFNETGSFSVVRVVATDYTDMRIDFVLNQTVERRILIPSSEEIKLPADLPNARDWEIDIVHLGEIHEVIIISRQVLASSGRNITIRQEQDPFTWLDKRIFTQEPTAWSVGRVLADDYPVKLVLFAKGRQIYERVIWDGKPFRFPAFRAERQWMLDVESEETIAVHEVALATSMGGLNDG